MNDEPIPLEDEIYEEEIEVEEEPSVMMAMWGEITGDIDNQTDLKEALDAKQDNLTQAQLDAVNSGINSTKVETYDGYQAQINTRASQSALDAEAEARRQADSTLQGKIDAEETARKASDKDIQDVLDGETLARQNADTALGGRIDTEIHDRQVADIALQGQIDAITSKSDVVDVVATYADLQAYDTQHLGNNDVIKVLDDETHGDALTYYRWSKTNQTWAFIGQEAPYYSKSQTDTLLLGKQNTIDSSHKLSADLVDDTSTTNKFVAASDITNWNGKQDALTAGTGIDITGGVISTPAIVPEVVAELPATGTEGKLYLTPKAHTTSTATGNPIEATVTEQAGQLESFQLDGDTFQQTYTGKNSYYDTDGYRQGFLGQNGEIVLTAQSVTNATYIEASENTQYVMSFNAIVDGVGLRGVGCYDPNKDFIRRIPVTELTDGAFQTAAGTAYIRVYFYNANGLDATNFPTNYISDIQLELGSTPTSGYEPYVGGHPSPSPEYPQQIQTVTGEQTVNIRSKNLFVTPPSGENRGVTYTRNQDGTYSITGKATGGESFISATTDKITIQNGDSIYLSSTSDNAVLHYRVEAYNGNTWLSVVAAQSYNMPIVVSLPSNTTRLRFGIGIADGAEVNLSNVGFQLEKSSTATAYTPYISTDYPISLGSLELCKLGTYQDYIYKDGDDWKVHKKCKTITLDGSEDWQYSSNYSFFYAGAITGMEIPVNAGVACYCRTHKGLTSSSSGPDFVTEASGYSYAADVHTAQALARIKDTRFSSTQDFANWLTQNNTTIYYVVKSATDTAITDQTLIAQLEAIRTASLENGTNTITNTATGTNLAGDMEIGYYGFNPTNRYDKFIWLDLNNNYEQIGGE